MVGTAMEAPIGWLECDWLAASDGMVSETTEPAGQMCMIVCHDMQVKIPGEPAWRLLDGTPQTNPDARESDRAGWAGWIES